MQDKTIDTKLGPVSAEQARREVLKEQLVRYFTGYVRIPAKSIVGGEDFDILMPRYLLSETRH